MPENVTRASPPKIPSQLASALVAHLAQRSRELGFDEMGICDTRLGEHERHLVNWLDNHHHGEMSYMARHGTRRSRPHELIPGTESVIVVRMNHKPDAIPSDRILATDTDAYVARYALGRDYHKIIRKRLTRLWESAEGFLARHGIEHGEARAFTDSAPVLEKALAEKAGLGWIGKNTLLINRKAGSWFFLGEIFTNLALPRSTPHTSNHCGSCSACIDICPTDAIVGPQQLDARRCISYLTIELRGSIDMSLRPLIGNRIFGCDDCQLVCPWNRYARVTDEVDFTPRHRLDGSSLLELFSWSESEFLQRTEGSAIRRTGYQGWLRNIAIALGNARYNPAIIAALAKKKETVDDLIAEHISWALTQQAQKGEDKAQR